MESLDVKHIRQCDEQTFYDFLWREYFPWKYTDPRWLKRTRGYLQQYAEKGTLTVLWRIKEQLFTADLQDIRASLMIADEIKIRICLRPIHGLDAQLFERRFRVVVRLEPGQHGVLARRRRERDVHRRFRRRRHGNNGAVR